jgi:hypothetical protein
MSYEEPMRYEPPKIVRREEIKALLKVVIKSGYTVSDVHLKENIVPVTWGERYEPPAVVAREELSGLLVDTVKSQVYSTAS